jgi:hypothetical protein
VASGSSGDCGDEPDAAPAGARVFAYQTSAAEAQVVQTDASAPPGPHEGPNGQSGPNGQ